MAFNLAAFLRHLFNVGKPKPKPVDPVVLMHALTVRVNEPGGKPVEGAAIAVHWADVSARIAKSDAFGRAFLADIPDTANPSVLVTKYGYTTWQEGIASRTDVQVTFVPNVKVGTERGRVRVDGTVFRREDGSIFPWVGCSDFALFARFCRGEDIGLVLDQRIDLGFNILRVFGMFDRFGIGGPQASGLGEFTPANTPGYYGKLRSFVTDVIQPRAVRIEFVVLADADARPDGTGGLLPTLAEQQTHLTQSLAALTGTWGATVNWANEAFKNAERVTELNGDCHAAGVVCTYGTKLPDGEIPTVWPTLDYLEPHDHERKDEWPRTARGYGEIVDALKVPVVANEPIGYAEVARPGSRATDPNDAAYFAATMQMFAAGSTFHSDDGVASRLFRPVQLAAAKAWATAARWVPAEAQLAPYQRGGAGGGDGIGEMPIEHRDLGEGVEPMALRTFAKRVGNFEYVVAVRPSPGWQAIPRNGWRIVEQPRLGFVKLTR